MPKNQLSFADVIILREDIAETIVREGVEMDLRMVTEYHDYLFENLVAPFSVLVNKINSYTYTFEAQQKLATMEQINAMAVISYSPMTQLSTRTLAAIPRTHSWNMRQFTDRETALAWLVKQQDNVKQTNNRVVKKPVDQTNYLLNRFS